MKGNHIIEAQSVHGKERAQDLASQSFRTAGSAGPVGRALLVEPHEARRTSLRNAVRNVVDMDGVADFLAARTHLLSTQCNWLLTSIRLEAYNGLHLVHMAILARLPIRFLVYTDRPDLWLAREAQRLGAFYESGDRLNRALPALLQAGLPPQDCRSPADPARRTACRGGLRCTDSSSSASLA